MNAILSVIYIFINVICFFILAAMFLMENADYEELREWFIDNFSIMHIILCIIFLPNAILIYGIYFIGWTAKFKFKNLKRKSKIIDLSNQDKNKN